MIKQLATDWDRAHVSIVLKASDTVGFNITSVAPSGMSRTMNIWVPTDNMQLSDITAATARILGWTLTPKGVRVQGTGMDMRFHVLDCLSQLTGRNANDYRLVTL